MSSAPTTPPSSVALSVDIACLALERARTSVLLVKRSAEPYRDSWALPGGLVQSEESLDSAARRVLRERTGIDVKETSAYLEQLYTFGDPGRDPRGRTIAVAYSALVPNLAEPSIGRDVSATAWYDLNDLPPLAFDHAKIVRYARWRLEQKIRFTPLAFHVLPSQFTMGDLRAIHEAVEGGPLHPSNFERQMFGRWALTRVQDSFDRRTRRPARVYRYTGPPDVPGNPDALHESEEAGAAG